MPLNIRLCPRPWSSDRPRVPGYEPQIRGQVERVSRSKRNAWRVTVLVAGHTVYFSHHDTKQAAESKCETMIDAYAQAHYTQV